MKMFLNINGEAVSYNLETDTFEPSEFTMERFVDSLKENYPTAIAIRVAVHNWKTDIEREKLNIGDDTFELAVKFLDRLPNYWGNINE